jgi:precorrin-6Y C5,15-methyltransferase (decarboxylating)
MTKPWLSVVGLGEDGVEGLSPAARALIDTAEVIVGGARHLALLPVGHSVRLVWSSPFSANFDRLETLRGRRVCVLASGDPMWFGVGATLVRRFPADQVTVLAHPGAFSLAAARMGWALHETVCLTIHGRPLAALALHLAPSARLLVLSEDASSPAKVAALLTEAGYGKSRIFVLERLGGPQERRFSALACEWQAEPGEDLNILAIDMHADAGTMVLGRAPGLPDDAYLHDGQLTKREVRAVTLSALAPWPGALLWDVGAGCGSIAIEWARAGGRAVAIEREPSRADMIARNAAALGVPQILVVLGEVPGVLSELDSIPDAIFIGGGVSGEGVLDACWKALKPGGRLVANAVTAEAETALTAWQARHGGEFCRIAVSRLSPTGRFHSWHPLMPVTQYLGFKR